MLLSLWKLAANIRGRKIYQAGTRQMNFTIRAMAPCLVTILRRSRCSLDTWSSPTRDSRTILDHSMSWCEESTRRSSLGWIIVGARFLPCGFSTMRFLKISSSNWFPVIMRSCIKIWWTLLPQNFKTWASPCSITLFKVLVAFAARTHERRNQTTPSGLSTRVPSSVTFQPSLSRLELAKLLSNSGTTHFFGYPRPTVVFRSSYLFMVLEATTSPPPGLWLSLWRSGKTSTIHERPEQTLRLGPEYLLKRRLWRLRGKAMDRQLQLAHRFYSQSMSSSSPSLRLSLRATSRFPLWCLKCMQILFSTPCHSLSTVQFALPVFEIRFEPFQDSDLLSSSIWEHMSVCPKNSRGFRTSFGWNASLLVAVISTFAVVGLILLLVWIGRE